MKRKTSPKLPVDLQQLAHPITATCRARLEEINNSFLALKKAAKELDKKKGIKTREIGQAKKTDQPYDALKIELTNLAQQIADIRIQQSNLISEAASILGSIMDDEHPKPSTPSHFTESTITFNFDHSPCRITDATQEDCTAWDQYTKKNGRSTGYHLYLFRNLIETSFGQNTIYLIARNSEGEVTGILPSVHIKSKIFGNYIVSMPYFNYGGALADSPAIETSLMKCLTNRATELGATHIEFRDTHHREGWLQKTEKASLTLKLPKNGDSLWADIGSKVRAQIKKAESNDLSIRFGRAELLTDFYQVFAINMRDLGTPVYSRRFFEQLITNTELNAEIVVAYHHGKPVSCGFLMGNKDTLEIPWASTLRRANSLNANMFLYWQILKRAIEQEYAFFDFGRSSVDAGTFKFKKQWGAQALQLYWHYWLRDTDKIPALNPNNPKFRLAIAVWQLLPVWLTKIIGPFLVKNLP